MEQKVIDEVLKSHFLSLYCMTVSDSDVSVEELETLYKIGLEYGISRDEIQSIIINPNTATLVPDTLREKIAYLYDLTRIANSDGKIVQEEKDLIGKYVIKYGFPAENSEAIVEFFIEKVKEGISLEEILAEFK